MQLCGEIMFEMFIQTLWIQNTLKLQNDKSANYQLYNETMCMTFPFIVFFILSIEEKRQGLEGTIPVMIICVMYRYAITPSGS